MTRHRRRHAKPGIGVDIAAADEALHQLVGDVVVLGQELAGDIEGDSVRPMFPVVRENSRRAVSASSQLALTVVVAGQPVGRARVS